MALLYLVALTITLFATVGDVKADKNINVYAYLTNGSWLGHLGNLTFEKGRKYSGKEILKEVDNFIKQLKEYKGKTVEIEKITGSMPGIQTNNPGNPMPGFSDWNGEGKVVMKRHNKLFNVYHSLEIGAVNRFFVELSY